MKIKIHVTKDVLRRSMMCGTVHDKSKIGKGDNCAVALAIRDLFPKYYVGMYEIFMNSDTNANETVCQLPIGVSDFIKAFDDLHNTPERRLLLPEISFDIDVPMSEIEKIGISEAYRILSESKTLELIHP
jgi:hypothetical protein